MKGLMSLAGWKGERGMSSAYAGSCASSCGTKGIKNSASGCSSCGSSCGSSDPKELIPIPVSSCAGSCGASKPRE